MVKLFIEVLDEYNYELPILTAELIRNVAENVASNFNNEFDIDYIVEFCIQAYNKLVK